MRINLRCRALLGNAHQMKLFDHPSHMQATRMRTMGKQLQTFRGQLEEDKQLASLMAGLRGSNLDDSDFADSSVIMQLVEVSGKLDSVQQ